ncbi:MAG: hypothetical protein NTW12_10240 [Deltaproteobacteria bacterium]|nr:hypothetical protein [Deltaproteobacteria bacterium]
MSSHTPSLACVEVQKTVNAIVDQEENEAVLGKEIDIYEFPDGIMGGFADEFAEILSNHLESARHFFFFTIISSS